MESRTYKYKLDFYYKSLIVYMLFFIVYVIINGEFIAKNFSGLYKDPVTIICFLFILYFLFALLKNTIRAKEIIFLDDQFIIKNRFGQRDILFNDILSIRFSRERRRRYERKSDIGRVKLKLRDRKRYLRIRLSDFLEEKKLIQEFRNISKIISTKPIA